MYRIDNGILYCNKTPVFALGQSYYASFNSKKVPVAPGEDRTEQMKKDLRELVECGFNLVRSSALGTVRQESDGTVQCDYPWTDEMVQFLQDELDIPAMIRLQGCGTAPNGADLDTTGWRVSNLFAPEKRIEKLWRMDFEIEDVADDGYVAVALNGVHGEEGAYAAFLINGIPYGCPDRAPSFPANPWEFVTLRRGSGYTYYFPLNQSFNGKHATVFVMGCDSNHLAFTPTAYLCCPPDRGRERIRLILQKKTIFKEPHPCNR